MTTVLIHAFDATDTITPATALEVDSIAPGDKITAYTVGTTLYVLRVKA